MTNNIQAWMKKCNRALHPASKLLWSILTNEKIECAIILEENNPDMVLAEGIVDKYGWGFIPSLVDPKVSEAYSRKYLGEVVGIIGKKVKSEKKIMGILTKRAETHDWTTVDVINVKENQDKLGVCDTYGNIGLTIYSKEQLFFHISFHEIDYSVLIKVGKGFPLERYLNELMELVGEYSKFTHTISLVITDEPARIHTEKGWVPLTSDMFTQKEKGVKICLNCQTRWKVGKSCPKCGKRQFLVEVKPLRALGKKGVFWKING